MHDRNGNPVKVGDRVRLEGDVISTSDGTDEYCNVTVKVTEPGQEHGPYNVTSNVVVNARQTEVISTASPVTVMTDYNGAE